MPSNRRRVAVLTLGVATALAACTTVLEPRLHDVAQAPKLAGRVAPLKVHLRSGDLVVLEAWWLEDDGTWLAGTGRRYTPRREESASGEQRLPLAEVALLETDDARKAATLAGVGLGALTTFWGAISAVCAIDPKSCFGSCPTFYLEGDDDRPRAEGFSSSIARALEATDLDALGEARPRGGRLALLMRNEALETHAVRSLRLLAAPRPAGTRVFAGPDGRFHPADALQAPAACVADDGACLAAVARPDGVERQSAADAADLAARESLELRFAPVRGRVGLVLGARQGLATTFVFYETLAALGPRAGAFLATLERGGRPLAERAMGMARVLGGIEVEVAEGAAPWRPIGRFDEAGPIAGDVLLLPFEASGVGPLRVRLRMARGNWKLDWIAVARIGEPVTPRAVEPSSVEREGRPAPEALAALRDPDRYLVTQPGDAYRVVFALPPDLGAADLFLESRGYYYEWLRREWLAEEDPELLALMIEHPEAALRRLAAPYKAREALVERAFWQSRFRRTP